MWPDDCDDLDEYDGISPDEETAEPAEPVVDLATCTRAHGRRECCIRGVADGHFLVVR